MLNSRWSTVASLLCEPKKALPQMAEHISLWSVDRDSIPCTLGLKSDVCSRPNRLRTPDLPACIPQTGAKTSNFWKPSPPHRSAVDETNLYKTLSTHSSMPPGEEALWWSRSGEHLILCSGAASIKTQLSRKRTLGNLPAKHEAPGSPTPIAAAGAADGGERDVCCTWILHSLRLCLLPSSAMAAAHPHSWQEVSNKFTAKGCWTSSWMSLARLTIS
jgi:hypothetical protein